MRFSGKDFFLGSVHEIIQHLLNLQSYDKEIFDIEQKLQSLPGEYDKIKKLVQAEKNAMEEERQALLSLEVKRKDGELQLQQTDDKILKLKTQQIGIKKVDEYKAMEQAIADAKSVVDKLETEILTLIEIIEKTSIENKLHAQDHEKRSRELQGELAHLQEIETALKDKLSEKRQLSETTKKMLAGPFLEAYLTLKQSKLRFPLLVELKNAQCTGCFMKVPRHTDENIKTAQDPVFCESCGRMLFAQD